MSYSWFFMIDWSWSDDEAMGAAFVKLDVVKLVVMFLNRAD